MWWDVLQKVIGEISGCYLIFWANGSSERANNKGDRTHPCLEPRDMGKEDEKMFAVMTIAEGLAYNDFIILMKFGPKWNLSSTYHKYSHSRRSKACLASKERTAQDEGTSWEKLITWSNLRMLSATWWVLIKPDWSWWFGHMCFKSDG